MSQSKDFWIIGVGASAGGLEALTLFFKSLPKKTNAAFIVAQHLAPHAKSMMVELLGRQTELPVVAIKDHLKLEPGVITIVPPNFDVTAEGNELRLTKAGEETRPKPSVDVLFQSLAKVYGRRAVGIILSGTGSDGTEGIRAIKESGGYTIVQSQESAKYDGMPKSAIDTGLVDVILTPEEIAAQLSGILAGKHTQSSPQKDFNQKDQVDFDRILKYLRQEIGTDFSQYKMSTIQRRIEKRLAALSMHSLTEYFNHIQNNAHELAALSQNMLVSVTSFFRDEDAFQAITGVLKEIISQKKNGDELRIWSAGCATGEEPYSLAFIVNNILEQDQKNISVKIFATDMDHEALAVARTGSYQAEDVKNLSAEILEKYFERKDKHYEVKKFIRDNIVFARQNIVQNPPFVKQDLISCRNVLIYFDSDLQEKVFEIFHYALRPQGYLFLGKSESTSTRLFDISDRKEKIFKRLNVASKIHPSSRYTVGMNIQTSFMKRKASASSIAEKAPLKMIELFGLSGVVVDEDSTILHIIGDVSRYVGLPVGQADFRLSNLLNKNTAVEFSILLKKASKEEGPFKSRAYKIDEEKQAFSFTVSIMDKEEEHSRQLFLVCFEPQKLREQSHESVSHDLSIPVRVLELEQEVAITRENLQTVIEELEISNEELQSLNEELSSTNEELQASNEELETTNEELQSTNEELMTLNEELNVRSSELRAAYASLDNIQSSISSPLVVIDLDLKILKFNRNSSHIFNIGPSDIGTLITKASCNCEIPAFAELLRDALSTGKTAEIVCQTDQRFFQLRVYPNRDENRKIIGAILIFFDNTDLLRAQEKLKVSEKRVRSIIDGSPTLISLKDTQGRYLMANQTFLDFFSLTEEGLIGKTDRDIFDDETSALFRENDLESLLKRGQTQKIEALRIGGKSITFRSNRFPLSGPNDRNPYAVGTVALDTTAETEARTKLETSESRYRAMIEDQGVFVCRHGLDHRISFVNNSFISFFGGSKDGAITFLSLFDPMDHKRVALEVSKITREVPTVQYEVKARVMSGLRWIRWIHRGIFSDEGQLLEFQAVGFDVTEIHNRTSDLLAKENLYTHVLEYTSDYLSVYRYENGHFILESFNQSAAQNRGFGDQRLIGKDLSELLPPEQSPVIISRFKKSVETNSISNFEETIDGPGGQLFLSTTIVPIHDPGQDVTRVVGLSRDITKLKRTERALRDEKGNAESANMAKSDFLASMSHELRTPLNVIMGMSQLLIRAKLEAQHVRFAESIQRSSKVLLSLIEDVLDLSKIEAGKINFDLKPFDLDVLTQDLVLSFEPEAARKKISLKRNFQVRQNIPLVGDEVRIKQVLTNLLGNAIKFTESGSVEFDIVLQSKSEDKSTIYFEVRDTGIGIPEEAYPKIFNRFSQADSGTSRKFGGTGLGLAISKQLVELMKGTIGFTSVAGEGSTFWFRIEFPDAVQVIGEESAPRDDAFDLSKVKVLAVDDNPESLKVLRYYFEERGSLVEIADSGPRAIEKFQSSDYDLILMDMQMPGMDGLETTKRIRGSGQPKSLLPIIALTANAMPQDKERCLEAGMNDFLTKPVDFEALNKKMKQWIKP